MHEIFRQIVPKHYLSLTGEPALSFIEAKQLVTLMRRFPNDVIWGGDVLSENLEHTYDSWYYESTGNKSAKQLNQESCEKAINYIERYVKRNGDKFFFVFVISSI